MGKKDTLRENDQSCAGKSLIELMEDRLDEVVESIMHPEEDAELEELKGIAKGITECLGIILQPYHPDRPLIHSRIRDAAMDRYYTEFPDEADED